VFNFRGQNMKQLLLAGVAALSAATAASAADMQARPYKAPPPAAVVSPAYNWSGFYVGAMGGYGWGTDAGSGGFGGGTVGYNWQFPGSQFVFGIEVDAAAASIKDSFSIEDQGIVAFQDSKINSFGSVTGRAGFAMDAILLYAKGGFAWGNNKTTISIPALGATSSDSQTHTGYTLGGGLEYLFTPSWSAKAEYMYTSLGGETYTLLGAPLDSGNIDFHTIKVGVNYHFR
jgi:outer membrane immunogenic protein